MWKKMPRCSKTAGFRNGRVLQPHSNNTDFTLHDFADSEKSISGRMKKGSVGGSALDDSLAWYNKDFSDHDAQDGSEDDNCKEVESPRRRRGRKSRHYSGREYPLDFWFILGTFIQPESVGAFSQICHATHLVSHSVIFWQSLYKRHHNDDLELPRHLLPQHLPQVHGLRARVISSLFHCYQPFIERLHNITSFQCNPDSIEGATCVLMWYQKVKPNWHFFFKFHRPPQKLCQLSRTTYSKKSRNPLALFDTLLDEADLFYNQEEHCCILQLVLTDFVSLPPTVMGQVLAKTFISVGHQMRFHKVKMVFSAGYIRAGDQRDSLASGTTIVLDPVVNMHLLHWWNPKYPHRGAPCKSPPLVLSPDAFS